MSNSKRWADDGETSDEMVPVDGFFLDGNPVRGQTADAARQTGADKNEMQEQATPPAQEGAPTSPAQASSARDSSADDTPVGAAAANELAMAFWGAPEAFPNLAPKNVKSPLPDASGAVGAPVWSMPPKTGPDYGPSGDAGMGAGMGADIPPMTDAPSFAPIPLRSAEAAVDEFSGAVNSFEDDFPAQNFPDAEPSRTGEDHDFKPEPDHDLRRESPFRTSRPSFGSQFDPFMGSPLGAPLGVPGGSDFFPGIPNLEFPTPSSPKSSSSFRTDPAPEKPSPIWATPAFDDPVEDAGRQDVSRDARMGRAEGAGPSGSEPFRPFPDGDEIVNEPGAEILPWPGRMTQSPIDVPIPVMGSGQSSAMTSDLSDDFLGGSSGHAPSSPFDSASPDLLAEAVESALRNVYGEDLGEDLPGERDPFMTERSLLREGGADSPEQSPSAAALRDIYGIDADASNRHAESRPEEGAEDWFGGRFDHQPTSFVAEPTTEAATEAVLHYLYGQGRSADGRHDDLSPKDDFPAAPEYGRAGASSFEDRLNASSSHQPSGQFSARRADDPTSFTDPSSRRTSTQRSEPTFRTHPTDDEAINFNAGTQWDRPQHQNMPAPGRHPVPARLHVPSSDSAAQVRGAAAAQAANQPLAERDSGRLLGVAGLGLIGGITLAGILAVFVFNSFVTDGGFENGGASGSGGTVSPRLGPDTANLEASRPSSAAAPSGQMLPESAGRNLKPSRLETGRSASDGRSAPRPAMGEERVAALSPSIAPTRTAVARPSGPIVVSDIIGAAPGPIPISVLHSLACPG